MRIVAFSDAHVDINSISEITGEEGRFLEQLIDCLQESAPDILVFAGDLTPDIKLLEDSLKAIAQRVDAQHCLFVPGNHDVWFGSAVDPRGDASSSRDKYERVLPQICHQTGFHFLPTQPVIIEEIGFLGSVGWYDYSFRNPQWAINLLNYAAKRWEGLVWNDVNYAEWEMSDPEVCEWLLQVLESDWQRLEEENMSDCFLILHHVPFRETVVYKNNPSWDFCSAFMGSQEFGDWARSRKGIKTVIFGHTHIPQKTQIDRLSVYCNPIGYLHEVEQQELDLTDFLKTRLTIIEKDL
ncbi:MAG: metallophosphoesterase [Candidatus Hodarchaeota archaeon]